MIWTYFFVPETNGSESNLCLHFFWFIEALPHIFSHDISETYRLCLFVGGSQESKADWESKGTLEQMDHVFKDSVSEEDESRRRAIEAEIVAGINGSGAGQKT